MKEDQIKAQEKKESLNVTEDNFVVDSRDNSAIVYIPRPNFEVYKELKEQGLPNEIKEQEQILDSYPNCIKQKIESIIQRIFEKNNLSNIIAVPNIHIADRYQVNASMMTTAKQPILILDKQLLKKVKSDDHLAAVIAHELGHLLLYTENKEADHQNKIEELAADHRGIELLIKAGYNPNAAILFLQSVRGNNSHLVSTDDLLNPDIFGLLASHPSEQARIRAMEEQIAVSIRNGELQHIPNETALDPEFTNAANNISYEDPISKSLKEIGYASMPVTDKLTILTQILSDVYFLTQNKTAIERCNVIAGKIRSLTVDFNDPNQDEAFKCLTDVLMGINQYSTNNYGFPPQHESIMSALSFVWRCGLKHDDYFARNEDLKNELELFYRAASKEEAEQYAAKIVILCNKISIGSRSSRFKGFYPPTIEEIKTSIETTGAWRPPYGNHVRWCKEDNSENIKKVLWGMQLDLDPWVAMILGAQHRDISNYNLHIYNPNAGHWTHFNVLSNFERNQDGAATTLKKPPQRIKETGEGSPYQWQLSSPDASLEAITNDHKIQGEKKRKHEETIIKSINWQLLKTDFRRFICQYGEFLTQYSSVVPIPAPFAQKFFEELSALLPNATDNFKNQLRDFFRQDFLNDPTPFSYSIHDKRFLHFYNKDKWPYEHAKRPFCFHLQDPFIQFLINPQSANIITDPNKMYFLKQVDGFINPDPQKKLNDIFSTPLQLILGNYPQNIKTVFDLEAESIKKESDPFHDKIAMALEAERLAYEREDSLSMEEFIILSMIKSKSISSTSLLFNVSNLNNFFVGLKHNTLLRLSNSDNCGELIHNYRLAKTYSLFDDMPLLKDAVLKKIKALISQLSATDKLPLLESLLKQEVLKPKNCDHFRPEKKYDGYIAEPEMRNWVIEQFADVLAAKLGKDDNTPSFQNSSTSVIKDITKNTTGITQLNLLSSLATKINAQKELAYLMRDTYQRHLVGNALSKHNESIAVELLLNESSKDSKLRQLILDYLAQALTKTSLNTLEKYIKEKYTNRLNEEYRSRLEKEAPKELIEEELQNYHKNFHAASFEMKVAYIEPLLFPLNSNESEQLNIIKKLIEEVFPIAVPSNAMDENAYARLIVTSYFQTTKITERRILSTALFVANTQEEQGIPSTIGQKLNITLSHLGPAGAKLLQAIHSHPQTPEDLKKDLATAKTFFAPPLRWELVEHVDQSSLLTTSEDNLHPVTHIGQLVGAGSFGLTVFNTLKDQTQVADTFLRTNAAIITARELEIMRHAAQKIVETKPELNPILSMIEEAKRSAEEETNMDVAQKQNIMAENSYHKIKVIVDEYDFTHEVAQLQKTGNNFKRVTIAEGVHFNDLPSSPYKTALAKAMVATQLSLRLAGRPTDLDRHGGNIKVQGKTIAHFDFGAMNLSPITKEDKLITGKIMAQLLIAVTKGNDFSKTLLTSIQNAQVSEASRIYLNGMNKDFLALGDYLHEISKEELSQLATECLTAKTVDPQINAAFKADLGYIYYGMLYGNSMINELSSKAQKAYIEITLPENIANNEQKSKPLGNKLFSQTQQNSSLFFHKYKNKDELPEEDKQLNMS